MILAHRVSIQNLSQPVGVLCVRLKESWIVTCTSIGFALGVFTARASNRHPAAIWRLVTCAKPPGYR